MALLTIVFTDVVESSATKRDASLGRDDRERDRAYLEKVQTRHFTLIRRSCQAHGGREVSNMGDAFYLSFDDPVEAVRCAVSIQKELAADPIETPRGPLRLRIGIHSGFPEFFEGTWHGTDVDTAARVEATATERQILISSRTYELVRHMADVKFHSRGEFLLKGVGRMSLWEADYDGKGPRPTSVPPISSQKRTKWTRGALVVLAAAILLAAALGYRIYTIRHAREMAGLPASSTGRRSVAVLGFKNLGKPDADDLSTALSEMFRTELAVGDQLRTIPGENVQRAKIDLSLPDSESYAADTLSRLHTVLGADEVVVGSYLELPNEAGGEIRLDLHAQDCVAGDTICTVTETGAEGNLFGLVSKAGADLRQRLGLAALTEKEATNVKAALPSDPEAARLYAEGLKKLRVFDAVSARDLLQKAVAADPNHALAHSALAEAWSDLGYDTKARDEAKKAFDLAPQLSRQDQLLIEGRYRELNTEWDKAIKVYASLWEVYPDNLDYGLRLADLQTSAGKGQDALATIEELRKMPAPSKDDPRIDLAEATAAKSLSDFKRAAAADAAATKKAQAQGARLLSAQGLLDECWALFKLGNLDPAAKSCRQAQDIFAAAGDPKESARAETRSARILEAQGQTDAALHLHQEALVRMRETGSQKDIAGALVNIADLESDRGDLAGARKNYEEALKISIEDDDKQHILDYENGLAGISYSQGDFPKARQMYEQVLARSREVGDQSGAAMGLNNVALISYLQGDLVPAQKNLREALAIEQSLGTKSDAASSLDSLGDVLFAQDDLEGAAKSYQEASDLRQKVGDKAAIAGSKVSLAKLALEKGQPAQAQTLAAEAQQEFADEKNHDAEISASDVLARALMSQGKLPEAESLLERLAKSPPQDRTVRLSLTITYARLKSHRGKSAESVRDLAAALDEANKMQLVGYEFEARLAQAEIELQSGKSALARTHLKTLQDEAARKGFRLIARHAAATAAQKESPRS
jgi:class 3 adenylate cyclase/tetratricopeptide (TPR) repeat protein